MGTRDILSTPPATTTSPNPNMMLCAAILTACKLDAQKRLTVTPAAVSGSPASAPTRRARFMPCSPSGKAQPIITSSIKARSRLGTRSTAARTARAARSSARTSSSAPLPARPIGVRTALTMTASVILVSPFCLFSEPSYLERVSLLLDYQCSHFTLDRNTIQHIITYIGTDSFQYLLHALLIYIGHDHLVQIGTYAREGEPCGQLRQLYVCRALLITTTHSLDGTGQRTVNGVQFDEQVGQVLHKLLFVSQRRHVLHILESDLHGCINGRLLSPSQSINGRTQLFGDALISLGRGLAGLDVGFDDGIQRHQINLAAQGTSEERVDGNHAVDLVRPFKDTLNAGIAVRLLDRIFLHKAVAAEDLHALVNHQRQHLAPMHLGQRRLQGILLNRLKDGLGILSPAPLRLRDIGGGTEDLTLDCVGLGSHTCKLFLNHAEFVQELAKSLAFARIGRGQAQGGTR